MFIDLMIRAGLWFVTAIAIGMVAAGLAILFPKRHWLTIYLPAGVLFWIAIFFIP